MALAYYDDAFAVIAGSLIRASFNTTTGQHREIKIHIRNDNALFYYTNMQLSLNQDNGLFGSSGFSIKMFQGDRQPTESEWAQIVSGNSVSIPDIGAAGAGDTGTYVPVWIRMYCPVGFSLTQFRDDVSFELDYQENTV